MHKAGDKTSPAYQMQFNLLESLLQAVAVELAVAGQRELGEGDDTLSEAEK